MNGKTKEYIFATQFWEKKEKLTKNKMKSGPMETKLFFSSLLFSFSFFILTYLIHAK